MNEPVENKLLTLLGDFGKSLEDDLIKSLELNEVVGGGGTASKLAGSIRFVFLTGNEKGVGITMSDYWEYVENGRRPGGRPPIQNIIDWIKWKGIGLKPLSEKAKAVSATLKGAEKKQFKKASLENQLKSMAFAIANNIAKKGTIKREGYKGTNFASKVLQDGRIEELTAKIATEVGIEVRVSIADALKQIS